MDRPSKKAGAVRSFLAKSGSTASWRYCLPPGQGKSISRADRRSVAGTGDIATKRPASRKRCFIDFDCRTSSSSCDIPRTLGRRDDREALRILQIFCGRRSARVHHGNGKTGFDEALIEQSKGNRADGARILIIATALVAKLAVRPPGNRCDETDQGDKDGAGPLDTRLATDEAKHPLAVNVNDLRVRRAGKLATKFRDEQSKYDSSHRYIKHIRRGRRDALRRAARPSFVLGNATATFFRSRFSAGGRGRSSLDQIRQLSSKRRTDNRRAKWGKTPAADSRAQELRRIGQPLPASGRVRRRTGTDQDRDRRSASRNVASRARERRNSNARSVNRTARARGKTGSGSKENKTWSSRKNGRSCLVHRRQRWERPTIWKSCRRFRRTETKIWYRDIPLALVPSTRGSFASRRPHRRAGVSDNVVFP